MSPKLSPGAGVRAEVRWEVSTPEQLQGLLQAPLPLGLAEGATEHGFHRDAFLDTEDGWLRDRGITCRFRLTSEDRRLLTLSVRGPAGRGAAPVWQRYDAETDAYDAFDAVRGATEPARRLRAMLDPERLSVQLALATERSTRRTARRWLQRAEFEFVYDIASLERGSLRRQFCELKVRRVSDGRPTLVAIASAVQHLHNLRPTITAKIDRARRLNATIRREAERRAVETGGAVALVVVDRGRIACNRVAGELQLPMSTGSGEGAARYVLTESFASGVGELRLLGIIPAAVERPQLEVWLAIRQRRDQDPRRTSSIEWLRIEELTAQVGTPDLVDSRTIAALLLAARSDVLTTRTPVTVHAMSLADSRASAIAAARPVTPPTATAMTPNDEPFGVSPRLLDGDRSLLEFNARVLAMAEDARTPLLERMRYIGIVAANLDEFFMVRVSALKRLALEVTGERNVHERTPDEQLADLRVTIEQIIARQERCCAECFGALVPHGMRLARLDDLPVAARLQLREYFRKAVQPALTPHAMTEAPGYPAPTVASGALSMLVVTKDPQTGPMHLASLRIPSSLPRFVPLPDEGCVVPIEEIVRDEVDALYPGRAVIQAYVFRVTRAGALDVNEAESGNLLQAIEEDARRRRTNAIVRVEVERAMPSQLRTLLLEELRLDSGAEPLLLGPSDVYEASLLVDLGALRELAASGGNGLTFPPHEPRVPFPPDTSIIALLKQQDLLVHHPYEDFGATVLRFLEEAADDPKVITIKATLYRSGENSPIVETLIRAAGTGKEVVTFVELKARFDEERNALWARRLTSSGVHVIYGLVGLKNHAKMLLVTRREDDTIRRYVHIGTGNYHAATARLYTDLGLFSADEDLTADISDLFNELTGSSQWPRGAYRRILVAPHQLLPSLLSRVQREITHAREGRGGRIRVKINGLSDSEMIDALYEASRAGVEIDLIVRGICRLRPGVPGLSERIRVWSILGRFLEHARIYHFANGGDDEYFIGSADWRARNVRRRIEVVAPVASVACRARLDQILERELTDTAAWRLNADGSYERAPSPPTPGSAPQLAGLAGTEAAREAMAS
jgi:polyphosphate kinase